MSLLHIEDGGALREQLHQWRMAGDRIALVPTMGNLHAGHLALVEQARRLSRRVVASIFVNPTQFGPNEDFDRYPRTLPADLEALSGHGCDVAFTPGVETMYPFGPAPAHRLSPPALADVLCGRHRPGHFDGVAGVVARLFNLVQPDLAVFGEKDFQQLRIIERMSADMAYGIGIIRAPTLREADGLAMSSRNRYLDADQRRRAPALHRTLLALRQQWHAGVEAAAIAEAGEELLAQAGFVVDYIQVRDEEHLQPARDRSRPARIFAAARLGSTRLIDNLALTPTQGGDSSC